VIFGELLIAEITDCFRWEARRLIQMKETLLIKTRPPKTPHIVAMINVEWSLDVIDTETVDTVAVALFTMEVLDTAIASMPVVLL